MKFHYANGCVLDVYVNFVTETVSLPDPTEFSGDATKPVRHTQTMFRRVEFWRRDRITGHTETWHEYFENGFEPASIGPQGVDANGCEVRS